MIRSSSFSLDRPFEICKQFAGDRKDLESLVGGASTRTTILAHLYHRSRRIETRCSFSTASKRDAHWARSSLIPKYLSNIMNRLPFDIFRTSAISENVLFRQWE